MGLILQAMGLILQVLLGVASGLAVMLHFLLFCLAGLVVDPSIRWLIICVLAFLISNVLLATGTNLAGIVNNVEARKQFLDKKDHYRLRRIEVSDELDLAEIESMMVPKFPGAPERMKRGYSTERLHLYQVECLRPPIPAQLKSYSSSGGTSVIFLRDLPGESDPVGRFKLYHEIGHITKVGVSQAGYRFAFGGLIFVNAGGAALIMGPSWWWVFLIVYVCERWRNLFANDPTYREGHADSFAFKMLKDAEVMRKVRECLEEVWQADPENKSNFRLRMMHVYEKLARQGLPVAELNVFRWDFQSLVYAPIFVWMATSATEPSNFVIGGLVIFALVLFVIHIFLQVQHVAHTRVIDGVIDQLRADAT